MLAISYCRGRAVLKLVATPKAHSYLLATVVTIVITTTERKHPRIAG
jgi:hypothetical protein